MNVLVLTTDAFGGRGGIAQFNRDMLEAICAHPRCRQVVALPRQWPDPVTNLPNHLDYRLGAGRGKLSYIVRVLRAAADMRFDAILCQHLHLLPLATLLGLMQRAPVVLTVYGVDAWACPRNPIYAPLLRRIATVVAISAHTRDLFLGWAPVDRSATQLVPCCVDAQKFGPRPKDPLLLDRYGLQGRTVLLTVGRLASIERYKGFDEMLEVLPRLAIEIPSIVYIIAGDGPDRGRLEEKATGLGVRDRVIFTGYVREEEKADHYRLADVFVLAGRGEGFGIVYLEAMACGIPVIASTLDASKETVLNGLIGQAVDPREQDDLLQAIRTALRGPRGTVPKELARFSREKFAARWQQVMDQVLRHKRAMHDRLPQSEPVEIDSISEL